MDNWPLALIVAGFAGLPLLGWLLRGEAERATTDELRRRAYRNQQAAENNRRHAELLEQELDALRATPLAQPRNVRVVPPRVTANTASGVAAIYHFPKSPSAS